MSKVVIEIKTDNNAFEDDSMEHELCRILGLVIYHIQSQSYDQPKTLFDINGNRVGLYQFIED